jgi:hypothetical protein
MALTRRSKPKTSVEAPKPLPARGKEVEPETYTCKGVETDIKPGDRVSLLGLCVDCGVHASHSEVDHLCYTCHKLKAGFVFDDDQKRWIKKGKR